MYRFFSAVAAVALALGLLASLPTTAASGTDASPPGRVLVVTANLQEAYDSSDPGDPRELVVFVDRVLEQTPHVPDVLLLQEVRGSSSRFVARELSERTGHDFRVALDVGEDPYTPFERHVLHRETTVVVDATTMDASGAGRVVETRYDRADAYGARPHVKSHVVTLVDEADGPLRAAVASVHYVLGNRFESHALAHAYKRRWTVDVHDALASYFPARSATTVGVVGGDFNASRCADDPGRRCEPSPFWRTLTEDYGYSDAIWDSWGRTGVDYLFTDGAVVAAGADWDYGGKDVARDDPSFYSDHRFRWAVVGPRR
ncbi:MAG TPA: endonuclease/exonuclease/phosphatase family protein [Actinomycetota bacterium]|nr:endonuclease/exonuclease/phosphatase family protein [Actinomycetota bacterium]